MNLHDLITALLGLSVIALGVAGVWLFGRDAAADEHAVTDYEYRLRLKPPPPGGTDWRIPADVREAAMDEWREIKAQNRRRLRPTVPTLAPAPWDALTAPLAELGPAVEAPIYEHMAARVILRELGEEARAKAGIRPAYATGVRDMTGSFPVVRAA